VEPTRILLGSWLVEAVRAGKGWIGRAEWRGPGREVTRLTRIYQGRGSKRRAFEAAKQLTNEVQS
jgi:hypothetical protein